MTGGLARSDGSGNGVLGTGLTGSGLGPPSRQQSTNLADILERVLDKGIVIAGDIRVNLLDIELLTIKIRLLVASVDKAREIGIDWWEHDPTLSSGQRDLAAENRALRERIGALEAGRNDADPAELESAGRDDPDYGDDLEDDVADDGDADDELDSDEPDSDEPDSDEEPDDGEPRRARAAPARRRTAERTGRSRSAARSRAGRGRAAGDER
jgi:hypothetical protein